MNCQRNKTTFLNINRNSVNKTIKSERVTCQLFLNNFEYFTHFTYNKRFHTYLFSMRAHSFVVYFLGQLALKNSVLMIAFVSYSWRVAQKHQHCQLLQQLMHLYRFSISQIEQRATLYIVQFNKTPIIKCEMERKTFANKYSLSFNIVIIFVKSQIRASTISVRNYFVTFKILQTVKQTFDIYYMFGANVRFRLIIFQQTIV